MNLKSFALVAVIGILFWGGWPVLSKASHLKDPFVRGFIVNAVTAFAFLPFVWGRMSFGDVVRRDGMILVIAGLLNLIGHALFPVLQTTVGDQISVSTVAILGFCIATNAVGGPLFFGDAITPAKVFFTLLILFGVLGLAWSAAR